MYTTLEIGQYIRSKRLEADMTQVNLAEKLNVSPQAISKWENGDSLPDTATLLPLAHHLNTSTDTLLTAGKGILKKKGVVDLLKIRKGLSQLRELRVLIGTENTVYKGIISGVTDLMKTDFELVLEDDYRCEGFVVEIAIQQLMSGYQMDLGQIDYVLKFNHWQTIMKNYGKKYI